jgi:hypothetical protein
MQSPKEVLGRIETEAQSPSWAVRVVPDCQPGEGIRQGDVYVHALPSVPNHGHLLATRQLVQAGSTSRGHVIEGDAALYERYRAGPFDGPLLELRSRAVLTHPEHAHISLPAGWYEVRYQIDYSAVYDRPIDGESPPAWHELVSKSRPVMD